MIVGQRKEAQVNEEIRQTQAEAEKYLGGIYALDVRIWQREDQLQELHRFERAAETDTEKEAYQQIGNRVRSRLDAFTAARNQIIDEIDALDVSMYSDLLFLRYVDRLSFQQIADALAYSCDYIRHQHRRALALFGSTYLD